MAKLNVAHMLILCVLVGASYFVRDCTAGQKPQHSTSEDEEAADCSEAEIPEADSDQEEGDATSDTALRGTEQPEKELQSTVKFKDTDEKVSTPTSDPALRGTEEPEEDLQSTVKLKDTDDEVPVTVPPAVHHLSVRDALPALKETENIYREALRLVATRAYLHGDTGEDALELVGNLVRLIYAVKSVRTYIEDVLAAWRQLKETAHHQAGHEERPPGGRKSEVGALLRF